MTKGLTRVVIEVFYDKEGKEQRIRIGRRELKIPPTPQGVISFGGRPIAMTGLSTVEGGAYRIALAASSLVENLRIALGESEGELEEQVGQLVDGGEVQANLEKRVRVSIPIGFKDRPDVEFNYDTYYDRPLTHDEKTHYMVAAANVLLHYLNLRGVTNEKYLEGDKT